MWPFSAFLPEVQPPRYNEVRADAGRVITPEAFCFIIDLDDSSADGETARLEFQLMPQVISENKSANYDHIPIIGRSLPLLAYGSSNSRQMTLSLEFVALKASGKYNPLWVRKQVRWLESKVYPDYQNGWAYPPHRLHVVIGEAIGLTCIMTSSNTTWTSPWSIGESGALPFRAVVDCTFEEYGMNEDSYYHPHGHQDALTGRNQARGYVSNSISYVTIPGFD